MEIGLCYTSSIDGESYTVKIGTKLKEYMGLTLVLGKDCCTIIPLGSTDFLYNIDENEINVPELFIRWQENLSIFVV